MGVTTLTLDGILSLLELDDLLIFCLVMAGTRSSCRIEASTLDDLATHFLVSFDDPFLEFLGLADLSRLMMTVSWLTGEELIIDFFSTVIVILLYQVVQPHF